MDYVKSTTEKRLLIRTSIHSTHDPSMVEGHMDDYSEADKDVALLHVHAAVAII